MEKIDIDKITQDFIKEATENNNLDTLTPIKLLAEKINEIIDHLNAKEM